MEFDYPQEHEENIKENMKMLVKKSLDENDIFATQIDMAVASDEERFYKHTTVLETRPFQNSFVCDRIESITEIDVDEFLDIVNLSKDGHENLSTENNLPS